MRCISGAGEAVFMPSVNTTTNIHQSSVVAIRGSMLSTIESNMVMEVKIGTNTLTSKYFTVIDTGKISFAQAWAIAEQSIAGSVETEAGAPTTVELTNDYEEYLVTFETVPDVDVLKGEFSARVRIAADSGNVVDGVERSPYYSQVVGINCLWGQEEIEEGARAEAAPFRGAEPCGRFSV